MRIVELAGGVGGARLAAGLQAHLGSDLTVIVNTADDTVRHGLRVCPDVDTVTYTLAGLDDPERGWGLRDETWSAADGLARLGEETWFRLGDRDLATHIVRTARLRAGQRLTDVTAAIARALGVRATIVPMSDDDVRTEIRTDDGWIEFQDYFVRRRQEPAVRDIRFVGIERAEPAARARGELGFADAIVIGPSNPLVSIGPILTLPGIRDTLSAALHGGTPIVAVSPIVAGRAIKGPLDRMLVDLGHEPTALGVARLYVGIASAFVVDAVDEVLAPVVADLGLRPIVADTMMVEPADRGRVARSILDAVDDLRGR